MMRLVARSASVAVAAVLAAAWAVPACGAAPSPARKPYDHYKLIETRNIFAPPATAAPAAGTASKTSLAPGAARAPVLTGIVFDARTETYKGLIETYGASEPQFLGPGDDTALGPVVRVTSDRLVVRGDGREIEVPLGGTLGGNGAAGEPENGTGKPVDEADRQGVLERMKSRYSRSGDAPAAEEAPRPESPPPMEGLSEKHRSILELLKERRRRSSGGTDRKE